MKAARKVCLFALALAASGCGGDDGVEPVVYESLAGTYTGDMAGVSQGVALEAVFSLTLTQSEGNLTGSYGITGTLNDGQQVVAVQGTGSLSGTVTAATNPSVNITITPGTCPNLTETFSGTYDSANERMTATGDVVIFDEDCAAVLVYSMLLTLTR